MPVPCLWRGEPCAAVKAHTRDDQGRQRQQANTDNDADERDRRERKKQQCIEASDGDGRTIGERQPFGIAQEGRARRWIQISRLLRGNEA